MNNEWVRFEHNNSEHDEKLNKFFTLPNLPHFAQTREDIKVDLFKDHPASEFYMLIESSTGDMIGCGGFYVTVDDKGITYCKSPYRLYISERGHGAYAGQRDRWENLSRNWLKNWGHLNIPFLTTVNIGNEGIMLYAMKAMNRYCDKLDPNDPYVAHQKSIYLHPKLVYEMYTWQYAWYNTNYVGFEREERDLPEDFIKTVEENWAQGYWLGSCGRNKLE